MTTANTKTSTKSAPSPHLYDLGWPLRSARKLLLRARDAIVPPKTDLPLDDVFYIMSSTRRRRTVKAIWDGERTISDLSNRVARMEYGDAPSDQERKRVYVSTYQTHLPALDERNVVDVSKESGRVDLGPEIRPVIRAIQSAESMLSADELDGRVTVDSLFFALKNDRRRHVVQWLKSGPGPISDISEKLASLEFGDDFGSSERKRTYVALYQVHLGRLEEAGVVEWDSQQNGEIGVGENHDIAARTIDAVSKYAAGSDPRLPS